MSELEVELHGGSGFPAQLATRRQRIFERAALEKKLARRIDQIGDVRRLIAPNHEEQFGEVGEPELGRDLDHRVGEDPFVSAAIDRAVLHRRQFVFLLVMGHELLFSWMR